MTELCGCIDCTVKRIAIEEAKPFQAPGGFRYACEMCGNKRCPHHTDHRLACSGSNAAGQPGSIYQ